ncbi:MAG: hypothetical protein EA388_02345 [Nitriliruptor sp.]|nr:MAG: hypothetical protein EA388_02345 [Nitriliruptor sp.]
MHAAPHDRSVLFVERSGLDLVDDAPPWVTSRIDAQGWCEPVRWSPNHDPGDGLVDRDDPTGMTTGSTARVGCRAVRRQEPERLILAIPVASPQALESLWEEADG